MTHTPTQAQRRPGRPSSAKMALWRAMRILGHFDLEQLLLTSNTTRTRVSAASARHYIKALRKANYLRQTPPGDVLIRNTGPQPPITGQTTLYDPNTQQITPYQEPKQ